MNNGGTVNRELTPIFNIIYGVRHSDDVRENNYSTDYAAVSKLNFLHGGVQSQDFRKNAGNIHN